MQALASTLNTDELAALRDQFDAIDVDKNNAISLEEMRHVGFLNIQHKIWNIHKSFRKILLVFFAYWFSYV